MKLWLMAAAVLFAMHVSVNDVLAAAGRPERHMALVEDGVSLAPVILADGVTPFTRRAAEELAGYIEKISGARPAVIEGRPDPLPEHAIWVGYQPVLDELFPDVDFEFNHPEEILLACDGRHVAVTGRDRWHPDHLALQTARRSIDSKQDEYGTCNAVYTLLQDYLGVRWLWPGELGEDVPTSATITLPVFEHRYHPQFRQRGTIFRLSALLDNRGISGEWTRMQRLQLDSLEVPGGHGFTSWWNRFHETNPDFFALQPDGTRSGFPTPHTVKMCVSNPAVWQQWLADVAAQLEQYPTRNTFNAAFNDSAHRGHCICEGCIAWDHQDASKRQLTWQGLSQDYVALSDRDVTFANHLGRLLKQAYPDQDYYVIVMAYGPTRPAPIEAVPDDNVIIGNVANMFWSLESTDRHSPDNETAAQMFKDWGKVAPMQIWRPNTGSAGGWQQGQPDVPLQRVAQSFRFAADYNCIGVFVDTVWEHWPTHAPLYYLIAQLAWNPWVDVDAVMTDYYRRGFGPAWREIRDYWEMMETARNRKVDNDLPYEAVYDARFFERAGGLLDRAGARAAGAPEKYARRIEFLRAGLDFTRLMVDTRVAMDAYRASRNQDQAQADRARANWEQMLPIMRENLMNYRSLRPGSRYAAGLHPGDG